MRTKWSQQDIREFLAMTEQRLGAIAMAVRLGRTTSAVNSMARKLGVSIHPLKAKQDLAGEKYGRLLVVEFAGVIIRNTTKEGHWLCRCECGKTVVVRRSSLLDGNTRSCGCITAANPIYNSLSHSSWVAMKARCSNPNAKGYENYGGRGIGYCQKWESFEGFYDDMGERPSDTTLERIDNEKGYEKSNCCWAVSTVQGNNRRSNRRLIFNGKDQTASQWSREVGIKVTTIFERIKSGWSTEKALTAPVRYYTK